MKSKKPACGLCGKMKNLTKTSCCDNWICDDTHKYVLFSYAATSCYRNHHRYTLCSYHHNEQHEGKWQECEECKNSFQIENYVDYATNEFNFEKLANSPVVYIKCAKCNFESTNMRDFAFQISNKFYCRKKSCQKSGVPYL